MDELADGGADVPVERRVRRDRVLDVESLKGLAHPLRVQILDALSTYGSFTASGLAERLGESSGATSYHLRQLERHGFVQEDTERGSGRERWWERVPGGIEINQRDIGTSASALSAARLVERQWENSRANNLRDFSERGFTELASEWWGVSTMATISARLTSEQLATLSHAWEEFEKANILPLLDQNPEGSRPVQIHFNAFPVIDGDTTPRTRKRPTPGADSDIDPHSHTKSRKDATDS